MKGQAMTVQKLQTRLSVLFLHTVLLAVMAFFPTPLHRTILSLPDHSPDDLSFAIAFLTAFVASVTLYLIVSCSDPGYLPIDRDLEEGTSLLEPEIPPAGERTPRSSAVQKAPMRTCDICRVRQVGDIHEDDDMSRRGECGRGCAAVATMSRTFDESIC